MRANDRINGNDYFCDQTGHWKLVAAVGGGGTGVGCYTFFDAGGANSVEICAPTTVSSSYTMSLPTGQGAGLLANDGAGNLFLSAVAPTVQNGLVSGGQPFWTTGLNFSVPPAVYNIGGVTYTSAQQTVTAAAADGTNPRIDVIYVDNTGTAAVLDGTASTPPVKPSVDPTTQLELTFFTLPAGSATPAISNTNVYLENTEWTCTASANFNCASTNNPYAGTKDIEATTAVAGNNVTLVKPAAGTEDLATYSNLTFYIRSKAAWPNAKSLALFWKNGTAVVGSTISLKTGVYGFNSSTLGSYQQVTIPTSAFGTGSSLVTTLVMSVAGGGGSIGFYVDNVILQSGFSVPPPVTLSTYKTCVIPVGADNASAAIVNADIGPQLEQCQVPASATVVEITVTSDAGTPSFLLQKRHCSTFTAGLCTAYTLSDLMSGALSAAALSPRCARSTVSTACVDGTTSDGTVTLSNTALAAGDWIESKSGTAGGVAKRMTIVVHLKGTWMAQ